jgi:DNA-binding NarL/FixJ family response regulator
VPPSATADASPSAPPGTPELTGVPTILSPREREVATLIARGLSNRQIGECLLITRRTAAAHVEHILDKLALTSRTQVGIWAAEHGLRS